MRLTKNKGDLTQGGITRTLLAFTLPMMAGSLLQQCYNITDTLIVGQFVGSRALAAVGSAYTLMVFLTSILLGLSMGSGTVFSQQFGAGNFSGMRRSIFISFVLTGAITVVLNIAVFVWIDPILGWLSVPEDVYGMMRSYLVIIFAGIVFTFLSNFYSSLLRAVGDSMTPLIFFAVSAVLNIGLDLFCILVLDMGIEGAALATVISQGTGAALIVRHTYRKRPELRPRKEDMRFDRTGFMEILSFSSLTCIQQSVMNFGILLVQGLVNSFGTVVMAAFAAAVKIDSFAYTPVQEFGNAFSTFIAQNFGAGRKDRIRRGVRSAVATVAVFSVLVSVAVFIFARALMLVFVRPEETEIIRTGMEYLRIEGAFYVGIGILFLLYGYYRAIRKPGMSVVLTVLSLGTRVGLSYWLASVPSIAETGIWWSIPIGWALADIVGIVYYRVCGRHEKAGSMNGEAAA
ncbi:MAG: MATE family efflux transporter [Muribaculum sp.]|uniref:Multidrug-efflux transporter n=1 Tax=Candidatus Merdivivens faecigallinarum TaxID=2840871 RepID=A0A9D9J1L9_9BACT|nr:MATE family efflux transporter [Candidatus Merdivivens faecigallinarum]